MTDFGERICMVIKKNPFKYVRKRDGRLVQWDQARITNAIYKAMRVTGEGNLEKDPQNISDRVVSLLIKRYHSSETLNIEDIQDIVEDALILSGLPQTAKAYIVYRRERAQFRDARKNIPDHVKELTRKSKQYFRNQLGEFIYYRTYSRWIEDEGRRETWTETVDRFVNFMKENLGDKL